jgi:predicted TIM-barrel fold metal-dependent hydrolase
MTTRFASHYDLVKLPYFGLRDERHLVLVDDSIGPVIDAHTHLALSYLRRSPVDLWRNHQVTRHYLPMARAIDLDVYMNRNFSADDLKRLKYDLVWRSFRATGMRATHTAANLLAEMTDLGIARSLLLPIDFPVLSDNAESYLAVAARDERLLSLGSVHPYARRVGDRLAEQKARGARGIKLHPAVQMVAPDDARAMRLYGLCGELGLPVLFHCGPVDIETRLGRRLSQLKHYWPAIAQHPTTTFVLGHSGALQMTSALELAQRYGNVYLELSCQSLCNVRRILAEGPEDRLLFGSDWPFYHQASPLAKVLLATEDNPSLRRRVLWENAAGLFRIAAPARTATAAARRCGALPVEVD